jgi:hypothetical protein
MNWVLIEGTVDNEELITLKTRCFEHNNTNLILLTGVYDNGLVTDIW